MPSYWNTDIFNIFPVFSEGHLSRNCTSRTSRHWEPRLVPGHPKCHRPPVRAEADAGQEVVGLLSEVSSIVGLVGPWIHSAIISQVPACLIRTEITKQLEDSPVEPWNEGFCGGKAKWRPLEWLSSRQRVSGSHAAAPERGGIKTKQNRPQTLESEVLISTVLSFKSLS